ncbi:uncharacterized protein LOC131841605 [Achroia grisella]|uniref:uncharacterized protein LOC131841605 n=1 Tax=Achroia grisella TaxID=688607 RepID=UPI0027D1F36F|nr:uncharacterized protein LOC131841605 [Achroia grisella]
MVDSSTLFHIFIIIQIKYISTQFAEHVDLQNVGEIIHNGDKYNILKPTFHVVTDYFKDFMMRRDNEDFPLKRVFIDKSGFRHYWTILNNNQKTSRKIDITENLKKYKIGGKVTNANKIISEAITTKNTIIRKKPKRKKKINKEDEKTLRQSATNRTVATTSFFCPFFGVITMSAFVD